MQNTENCHCSSKQQPKAQIETEGACCRICLLGDGVLVSLPCQCKGDLSKIHEECFLQWVNCSGEHTLVNQNTVRCDVCLKEVRFTGSWGVDNMKLLDKFRKSENWAYGLNWLFIQLLLGYFVYRYLFEDSIFAALFWLVPFISYGVMQVIEIKQVWLKKSLQSIRFQTALSPEPAPS